MSGLVPNPSAWESDNERFVLVTWLARESVTTLEARSTPHVQCTCTYTSTVRSTNKDSLLQIDFLDHGFQTEVSVVGPIYLYESLCVDKFKGHTVY